MKKKFTKWWAFLVKWDLEVSLFLFVLCMLFFGVLMGSVKTALRTYVLAEFGCRVGDALTGRKEWDAWYREHGEEETDADRQGGGVE